MVGTGACFTESPPPAATTESSSPASDGDGATSSEPCDQGSLDCACFPNGTCAPPLVCSQGVCIPFDSGTTAVSTGPMSTDTSTTGDTTEGSVDTSGTTSMSTTSDESSDEGTTAGSDTTAGPSHILFTTSGDFAVTEFTMLGDADNICSKVGSIVSPGPWVAVLRNSMTSHEDRITIEGPVYDVSGVLLAEDAAGFFSGTLLSEPGIDEHGDVISESDLAWTGTATEHCNDWQNDDVALTGGAGLPSSTDSWLDTTVGLFCSAATHLYCISQ